MKKYLKYIFVFVCVIILLTSTAAANDTLDEYREDAQMLNNIGFMQGDDGGMRLFDELNRAEAATLLCRAYGGELEAKYYEHKFTFTDVPDWAIPYVAYMSENGIIRGRTAEVFDPFASVTMQEFYTMLLRMLGYSDADGDFEYAKVLDFAKSIDLISDEDIDIVKNRFFCRIDAAHAVVSALRQPCKGSELTLAESRASYIDSSYDMELAKVVLGKHEAYNQMEKTRKAMSMGRASQ